MVLQEDRAADANPSRMAALPAYRDGKAMPKAFANPMGLNDRLAVGGLWPWNRGCGGGGIGKTGLAEHGWAQSSAEDRALRGWHRWAFARARSADAVLAGFAGQVRPAQPHLPLRARARPKAPEAAHLPPCKGRTRGREPSLVASFAVWCRPRALATRSAAQICFPDLVGAATPLPGLGDDRQAAPRRAISRPNRSLPRGGQVMAFTDLLESAWKPDHERTVPPPLF